MRVDAREAEILERRRAHRGADPIHGGSRVNRSGSHRVQQFL
jgi:hypothetical protein